MFVHGDAECELGSDLAAVFSRIGTRSVAGGELAESFAIVIAATSEIGDPCAIADLRAAVGFAHFFQQWSGRWIVADVIECLDPGVAFHVRLAGEDEDLERAFFLCLAIPSGRAED